MGSSSSTYATERVSRKSSLIRRLTKNRTLSLMLSEANMSCMSAVPSVSASRVNSFFTQTRRTKQNSPMATYPQHSEPCFRMPIQSTPFLMTLKSQHENPVHVGCLRILKIIGHITSLMKIWAEKTVSAFTKALSILSLTQVRLSSPWMCCVS